MLYEIHRSETGRLRTEDRSSPSQALACKDTCIVLLSQLLVHSVHETDFASADSDISCRNILVRTDNLPELKHEGLAETHDLGVRLSSRIEVRTTLSTTHREGCEGILECLFETEEFQDRKVHRRVEADTSLVRTDGRVELHTVSRVCLNFTVIVDPSHFECEDALRFNDTLDDLCIFELRMLVIDFLNRLQYFVHRLKIFLLIRVLGLEFGHQIFSVHYLIINYGYFTSQVDPLRRRSSTH